MVSDWCEALHPWSLSPSPDLICSPRAGGISRWQLCFKHSVATCSEWLLYSVLGGPKPSWRHRGDLKGLEGQRGYREAEKGVTSKQLEFLLL